MGNGKRLTLALLGAAGLGLAAALATAAPGPTVAAPGAAEETRPAETTYQPAFAGQTRAPKPQSVAYRVEKVADGLEKPWSMAFLPDGRLLVTEQGGAFRFVGKDGVAGPRTAAQPAVYAEGQGGLLDVALDPDFATNHVVWWSYAEPRGEKNGTAVARGVLDASGLAPRFSDVLVVFRQQPGWASPYHFGSRIVFAPDKTVFVTLGERFGDDSRVLAQDLSTDLGKIVHLSRDGTPAPDNPFLGRKDARPEIWSYGHRNVQAAAIDPATGKLWTIEHGPRGGDELNQPQAGRNYGWPVISYGIRYDGGKIGAGITAKKGMEQPVYYWDPVIAPSGMLFYEGAMFPEWKGNIFVGALRGEKLVRLVLQDGRVTGEEWLAPDLGQRVRSVAEAPDGSIWLLTEEGAIQRISRKGSAAR